MGHSKHLATTGWDRGPGDKNITTFSCGITTDWMKQEILTMFNWSHATSGFGDFWMLIQYAPGDHWRYTILPRIAWSNVGPNANKARRQVEKDDTLNYIVFKIGYMF